jgi:RNA polymerase sigma-70 factor (ECF subfamily)
MMVEEREELQHRDGAESTLSKEQFKREVIAILPQLRSFARGICGNRDLADDLAQEAMMRAWASRHTFKVGTNFKAWMFIILRNRCYSMAKKNSRMVTWDPEAAERILVAPATQHVGIDLMDVQRALEKLPTEQREMLMLVAADMSYEEAAEITGCAIGTVKSRIARGRVALKRLLGEGADSEDEVAATAGRQRAGER